ncbi:uncharacterized protein BX663DRAFT_523090 [Cokeromyces recurvatus]|uniref:uncharacterized protein n=1 Tax=Cokeromyces recurvatus TaxID=90255 RepID=UPI00221F063D|nr:uncharacterized protein BX663DRAFT_523090 [Cokeromyces recurvatus]KAI7898864.1 hypothetical protein BX663DRAFT_523090 [Cokeromyces recurvatus]
MEEKPVTVASKSYIYRKLKELTINSNVPLILGRKLSKVKPHLLALETFVTSVKSRIADGTFTSEKYTDKHGYRFFTLLPIYSFETKSVQIIDATAFWRLISTTSFLTFSNWDFALEESLLLGRKQFE